MTVFEYIRVLKDFDNHTDNVTLVYGDADALTKSVKMLQKILVDRVSMEIGISF